MLRRLRELAAQAGVRDPAELASGLLPRMDGAFAAARMFGRRSPTAAAASAAAALIDNQLTAASPPGR